MLAVNCGHDSAAKTGVAAEPAFTHRSCCCAKARLHREHPGFLIAGLDGPDQRAVRP